MSTDDLDQIERLFRLRESGALSQTEFEAEKDRLLNAGNSAAASGDSEDRTLKGAYTPGPDRADKIDTYQDSIPHRSRWPFAIVGVAVTVVILAALAWYVMRSNRPPVSEAPVSNPSGSVANEASPVTNTEASANQAAPTEQASNVTTANTATAISSAPEEQPGQNIQDTPVGKPAPAQPAPSASQGVGADSQAPDLIGGPGGGNPDPGQISTSAARPSAAPATSDPLLIGECQELIRRLGRGEGHLKALSFRAQISRINGLDYSITGPMIANAISETQRYEVILQRLAPMDCVSTGNNEINKLNGMLAPLKPSR